MQYQQPVPQAELHELTVPVNKYPDEQEVHCIGKADKPVHEAHPAGAGEAHVF